MPRARNPNRDKAKEIFIQHKGNITNREIAKILEIDEKTVSVWKGRDKWLKECCIKKSTTKKVQQKNKSNTKKRISKDKEILKEVNKAELTEQQKLFCLYYIKNFNATQSYLKAYKCDYDTANASGSRMLVNVSIREEIKRLKELKYKSIMINENDIVEQYMRIAFADITDYTMFGSEKAIGKDGDGREYEYDRDYFRFKDSKQIDGGLISEVKKGKSGMSIKLQDKMKALEWLSNYFEMNPNDKNRKIYNDKKLELEQQRFEHQKKIDEMNNF